MSTLFDKQIDLTYQGLIKTEANTNLSATEQNITDGSGTQSTLSLGTTSASFTGALDLTAATVTGLPPSGVSSVVAGTNVTVDNTDPANPIVSAAGGGSTTPAMPLLSLPPIKGDSFGQNVEWKTWIQTTGYAITNVAVSNASAMWAPFSIAEGDAINSIQIFNPTAVAGQSLWVAIYRLEKDVTYGTLKMTDLLVDCGTVSTTTTGAKTINLGTPYVHGNETYGAVGIIVGGTTTGLNSSGWSSPVWSGNGGVDYGNDGTFYRSMLLNVTGIGSAPIASLTSSTYGAATSGAAYILIK